MDRRFGVSGILDNLRPHLGVKVLVRVCGSARHLSQGCSRYEHPCHQRLIAIAWCDLSEALELPASIPSHDRIECGCRVNDGAGCSGD